MSMFIYFYHVDLARIVQGPTIVNSVNRDSNDGEEKLQMCLHVWM